MESRRILVLGGTGFIGGYLVDHLRQLGNEVTSQGRSANADRRIDVLSAEALQSLVSETNPDIVVNLVACGATPGHKLCPREVSINAKLPLILADLLSSYAHPPLLVHASSSLTQLGANCHGTGEYGEAKHLALMHLRTDYRFKLPNLVVLQLHNVYGDKQPAGRFVRDLVDSLSNNQPFRLMHPNRRRDFSLVDDVAHAVTRIIQTPPDGYTEVEIGTGVATRLIDVGYLAAAIIGRKPSLVVAEGCFELDDDSSLCASVSPGDAGHCPTSLVDGLRMLTCGSPT